MREKERSRMSSKTTFYCYLFFILAVSSVHAQEQKLSPIFCGKNKDYSSLSHP